MGRIVIITPAWSPWAFGPVRATDMAAEKELGRTPFGTKMTLTADAPIDLGIAWGMISPGVKLRFRAEPGRTYLLYWRERSFGAAMGVTAKE